MVHIVGGAKDASDSGVEVRLGGGSVGFITKTVTYKGVAAHAGGAPWLGKNALYAAMGGLNASNAIRETFKDDDHVRWHPIITSGGDMVNNIPEKVVVEGMLRAATSEALLCENEKIDRALIGAAISHGAEIEICDEPGYAPLRHDANLGKVMVDAYNLLAPSTNLSRKKCEPFIGRVGGGSMDLGDLSSIMPTSHPYITGSVGKGHGNDYFIVDPETCCVTNAKWQVMILKNLLENGAEKARYIIENYDAPFKSKEEFLAVQDKMRRSGDRIEYKNDGTILIK
jgi:metal-dependent amidase/aminoacylase/carboxypeptidase family protein